MQKYSRLVEGSLCECLRKNIVPDDTLVEEISVAKIKALEVAIDVSHKFEQEAMSTINLMNY